jgi:hypothetical protein
VTPDDADLIFSLESCVEVEGVYALPRPRPGWPRLFVGLRDDSGHALGVVTGLIVRALPHRDRSYIGIAATDRLRELWSMTAPLSLHPTERAAAVGRAAERERMYAEAPSPLRVRVESEPAPVSVPVLGPFRAHTVWMMSDKRLVELEVVRDPFREQPPALLVVTESDELWETITRATPRSVKPTRARSVREALDAVMREKPARIVCAEALALGDDGLLDAVERAEPTLMERFEIVAGEGTADWLASYLESRARRIEILEEPLEDEAIDELVARTKKR